jgi:hypothetical protein
MFERVRLAISPVRKGNGGHRLRDALLKRGCDVV